jgi:hypothetical protein
MNCGVAILDSGFWIEREEDIEVGKGLILEMAGGSMSVYIRGKPARALVLRGRPMERRWVFVAAAVVIVLGVFWFVSGPPKGPQSAPEDTYNRPPTDVTAERVAGEAGRQKAAASEAAANVAADPRVDAAKWLEARAATGTIATCIRAYHAEVGPEGRPPRDLSALGIMSQDLEGTYFGPADYAFFVSNMNPLVFTVTCTPGSKKGAPKQPMRRVLDSNGKWSPE